VPGRPRPRSGLRGDACGHQITNAGVWPKAIHRVAADGISPEQAVEAIAQIKQMSE
jgi:hypothetical protein